MTIAVGDKIPSGSFKIMGADGPEDLTTDDSVRREESRTISRYPGLLHQVVR